MTKTEFNEFMEQCKMYDFVVINGERVVETKNITEIYDDVNVIYQYSYLQGLCEAVSKFSTEFNTAMVINDMIFYGDAYIYNDELVFSEFNEDIARIKLIRITNFYLIENYSLVQQLLELSEDKKDFILNGERVIGSTFSYNEYLDKSFYAVESKDKQHYESRFIKTSDIKDIDFILPKGDDLY